MISFKDRTFCNSDCINSICYRYLSKEDEDLAAALNLLIAVTDLSKDCKDYNPRPAEDITGTCTNCANCSSCSKNNNNNNNK